MSGYSLSTGKVIDAPNQPITVTIADSESTSRMYSSPDAAHGVEDVRRVESPGEENRRGEEHQEGQGDFDFDRPQRLGHVVQPPGVKAGRDRDGVEEDAHPQAVKGRGVEGLLPGDEVEQGENRRGEHEGDREVHGHRVRVAAQERKGPDQRSQGGRHARVLGLFDRREHAHLRVAPEHLRGVRRALDVGGEVPAGGVPLHVGAGLPHLARADVVDLARVGDVDGLSVFAGVLRQFFRIEFPHVGSRRRCFALKQSGSSGEWTRPPAAPGGTSWPG